eukprot:m.32576 g.32576  ORF g.32576 m.32576 type:complete len:410 (+) comp4899_c0_seq1:93-1322(+)
MTIAGLLTLSVLGGLALAGHARGDATECVPDWGKCGGHGFTGPTQCCNTRQYCKADNAYYSECVPKPLEPFPSAPASAWCGHDGTRANDALGDAVSPLEIALIWRYATAGLSSAHAPGGNESCVAAVTVALGECGHPAESDWTSINDQVCTKGASGAGGLWQVTSQDETDELLAGCSDGFDYCCNARLAYAHATSQGGATTIPKDYCELDGCTDRDCCGQLHTPVGQRPWNDPNVDRAIKPGSKIPDCSLTTNMWYRGSSFQLSSATAAQEPCWFGPFSIAGGGVGRPFFASFWGWGGFLQHYTDSKAGECDISPQGNADSCDEGKYAGLPTYSELAVTACRAVEPPIPPTTPPNAPPPPPEGPKICVSISPTVEDHWCDTNCHNQPPFCPESLCQCTASEAAAAAAQE